MNDDLSTLMTNLSAPAPPASLKATVMARIAREADRQDAPVPSAIAPAHPGRDRVVWLSAFIGLAVVLSTVGYAWISAGTLPNVASPRLGPMSIPLIPQGTAGMAIGLGLLVYLAGLFGPLRSDSRK
jgi:hypothetical protein